MNEKKEGKHSLFSLLHPSSLLSVALLWFVEIYFAREFGFH